MVKIPASLVAKLAGKKVHKYHAQRTKCLHGHDHDSKKEAMWCLKLEQMQKDKMIMGLIRQKEYELIVNYHFVCKHRVDFYYTVNCVGPERECIVEVKGMPTKDWIIKRKLFCALFPHITYQVV